MAPRRSNWITYAIIGFTVVFVVGWFAARTFLFDFHRVPSESMYPTIPDGSFIIVDKRGYGNYSLFGVDIFHGSMTAGVARGDIVTHKIRNEGSTLYVKRVIGLPGDKIEYANNHLTINGKPVALENIRTDGSITHATEVFGDLRIPIAWESDRYATDYAGVVPEDHYFVFGDNRNNSRDSRFVGPVPKELIVGRVVKVIALK